jgi:hypothetical protein
MPTPEPLDPTTDLDRIRERNIERLRRRHRRIFAWSIGIAVALHVAAFAIFPHVRFSATSDPVFGEAASRSLIFGGLEVDLRFGPPVIHLADGTTEPEPENRFLDRERIAIADLDVAVTCADSFLAGSEAREGEVRLRVNPLGYASVVRLERSTGDRCADDALVAAAEALWYRWIPNDRHRAPVELVQPVRIQAVTTE